MQTDHPSLYIQGYKATTSLICSDLIYLNQSQDVFNFFSKPATAIATTLEMALYHESLDVDDDKILHAYYPPRYSRIHCKMYNAENEPNKSHQVCCPILLLGR